MQTTPFSAVVPPSVAGGCDKLVGCKLVEHMTALDAPEGMFERTEGSTYNVHLGIVVVLCAYLVVQGLIEVGTSRQCSNTECRSGYIIVNLHIFICFLWFILESEINLQTYDELASSGEIRT